MRNTFLIPPLVFANQTDHCSSIHLPNVQVLNCLVNRSQSRRIPNLVFKIISKFEFRILRTVEMHVVYQLTANVILIPKHLKYVI